RDHVLQSVAALEVREHERPIAAHRLRVARHDAEVGADVRREIGLVDHEQIRSRDAGAALARNLVAARDVDHVDGGVDELGAEARGEVVAAALEKHDVEAGMPCGDLVERVEVHRRVLANRTVRHDLKSREWTYCCVIAAMSSAGVNDSIRASRRAMSSTTAGTRSRERASSACAAVWPIDISRIAADTVAARRV